METKDESQENIFGNTFLYLAAMSNPIQIELFRYHLSFHKHKE